MKFSDILKINEQEITLNVATASTEQPEQSKAPEVNNQQNPQVVVHIQPQEQTTDVTNGSTSVDVETNSTSDKKDVSVFLSKLFESREKSHFFHLQTDSFSKHKALEDYYTSILELIDLLSEVYTGQYGIVKDYTILSEDNSETDEIKYFETLVESIKSGRYEYLSKDDTHLQNIIDEIVSLVYRTLYKLKNLK